MASQYSAAQHSCKKMKCEWVLEFNKKGHERQYQFTEEVKDHVFHQLGDHKGSNGGAEPRCESTSNSTEADPYCGLVKPRLAGGQSLLVQFLEATIFSEYLT